MLVSLLNVRFCWLLMLVAAVAVIVGWSVGIYLRVCCASVCCMGVVCGRRGVRCCCVNFDNACFKNRVHRILSKKEVFVSHIHLTLQFESCYFNC